MAKLPESPRPKHKHAGSARDDAWEVEKVLIDGEALLQSMEPIPPEWPSLAMPSEVRWWQKWRLSENVEDRRGTHYPALVAGWAMHLDRSFSVVKKLSDQKERELLWERLRPSLPPPTDEERAEVEKVANKKFDENEVVQGYLKNASPAEVLRRRKRVFDNVLGDLRSKRALNQVLPEMGTLHDEFFKPGGR